jgi:hypothetical protein
MANLRTALLASALASLAACGGNGGGNVDALIIIPDAPIDARPIDAPPDALTYDFACVGNAAPATGPNPVTVAGGATDINLQTQMAEPVAAATVEAFRAGQAQPVATTTTNASGAWTVSLPNAAATPVDGYVRASKTGHRTTYLYPPAPMAANIPNAPILLLSNTTFSIIVQFVAQTTQAPGNGSVGLAVVDCANMPIAGATIAVTQNGAAVGNFFDASQLQAGASITFDVPPGKTDINVSYNGTTFRARSIDVFAGSTTTTVVRPGF